MNRHTLVAVFLVSCCCYGTTLVAQQRHAGQAHATPRATSSHAEAVREADAKASPAPAAEQADAPVVNA